MPHLTPAYLPDNRSWAALRKTLLVMGSVALGVAVVLASLNGWRHWPVMFGYTFAYTVGLWLANGYSVDWLNARLPWTDRPLRRLLITLLVSLGASLVVIVSVQVLFLLLYWQRPLHVLRDPDNWESFLIPLSITAMVSLFLHSRSFLLHWREAAVRAERLEKESAVARLDSLRRQVDPHFLFNSLNALTSYTATCSTARSRKWCRSARSCASWRPTCTCSAPAWARGWWWSSTCRPPPTSTPCWCPR